MKRRIKRVRHRRSDEAASLSDPRFQQRINRSNRKYLRDKEIAKALDEELNDYDQDFKD